MSRAFIAEVLKTSLGASNVAAKQAANELVEAITEEINRTGSFTLPGFGTFKKVETKARVGQNPRTGEKVKIKAGRTVRFKASQTLKETVG